MKLDFYHNKIVADSITAEFEDAFRKELVPLLEEKYGVLLEIQMYEDYISLSLSDNGYWYYPLTLLVADGVVTQWVRWPFTKGNFEDGNPYAFVGRGAVGFELADTVPDGFEEKIAGRAVYFSGEGVKVRVDIVGGDSIVLSGKYSQTFIDEMSRQLASVIENATGVTGIVESSVELVMVFAPGTYMEHTSENVTYRRLMLMDKVSAPRDFWIQWTRLDSAVAHSVSSHVNSDNILFELGEDVDQKIREKEYRYLLTSGKEKYHNAMGRKKVTEWRDVIKRAARRGELCKLETDFELTPETLELEERIADLLGKRPADRGGYEKEEIPFISNDDEFERAMEKMRRVVEHATEEQETEQIPLYALVSEVNEEVEESAGEELLVLEENVIAEEMIQAESEDENDETAEDVNEAEDYEEIEVSEEVDVVEEVEESEEFEEPKEDDAELVLELDAEDSPSEADAEPTINEEDVVIERVEDPIAISLIDALLGSDNEQDEVVSEIPEEDSYTEPVAEIEEEQEIKSEEIAADVPSLETAEPESLEAENEEIFVQEEIMEEFNNIVDKVEEEKEPIEETVSAEIEEIDIFSITDDEDIIPEDEPREDEASESIPIEEAAFVPEEESDAEFIVPVTTAEVVKPKSVYTPIADRAASLRAEIEAKIRLEYETRARAKAEQELVALRREQQKLKLEKETLLAEAMKEQERLRLEYEHLLQQTELAAAQREAEEEQRRAEEEQLRAQIEAQLRAEAKERERLAEAARMAIEEKHRLEAEHARIARQKAEEERIEEEKRRKIEEEKQLEALREAELARIRREDEEAKARAKAAMPEMGDGKYTYTSKSVKLLFRRSVDPNITTRIYEIMKATVEYYGKDRIYLKIKATVEDTQTVLLDFEHIPIEEMELLGNIIKILGNSGLGIAKAIIE